MRQPPRLAVRLAGWLAPSAERAAVLGDLAEEFVLVEAARGSAQARIWYWRQVVGSILPLLALRRRRVTRNERHEEVDMLDSWSRDLRHGLRTLWRNPVFSLTAVLSLGLGIGLNAGVFSVVRAALLRPLPYADAAELVIVEETRRGDVISVSWPDLTDWQSAAQLSEVAGYTGVNAALTGSSEAQRLRGVGVTGNLFGILGVAPLQGRMIGEADVQQESRVAVISYALWQRLGAPANLVGQAVALDGAPFTVIGIMPAGFAFPDGLVYGAAEFWQPITTGLLSFARRRDTHPGIVGIARVAEGVSVEAARTELEGIARRLSAEHPGSNREIGVRVQPALDSLVGGVRAVLWMLLAAVGFVLLIVCTNVASLFLTRATARQQEMAIRTALGAGRRVLAQQLALETAVVATAGGVLGVGIGYWVARAAPVLAPELPRVQETSLDAPVLLFAGALTVLAALISGSAPALQVPTRIDALLRERGASGGGSLAVRRALLVGEIALTVVLLVFGGVLLKSFQHVLLRDEGVSAGGVLTFDVAVPLTPDAQSDGAPIRQFYQSLLEHTATLPGVQSVGAISTLPFSGAGSQSGIGPIGADRSEEVRTDVHVVTPDYFAAVGIQLLEGRAFAASDHAAAAPVAIVDESFARRFWPGGRALGQRVQGWGFPELTIIGVVRHVTSYGVTNESREQLYVNHAQRPIGRMHIMVRTSGEPLALVGALRATLAQLDRNIPMYRPRAFSAVVDATIATPRIAAFISGSFAAIGVLLALIGCYGLTAFNVAQRRKEFGLRAALGASPGSILRDVLFDGLKLAALGAAAGTLIALAGADLISTFIYGVGARDPLVLGLASALMLLTTVVACLIPARLAARVDPLVSLQAR